MGRMKELFIEQMNKQIDEQMADADYQYEQYLAEQFQLGMLNDLTLIKYSDSDVESALQNAFGKFQVSGRLKDEIVAMIMSELNNLNNLRNGHTN
jgi:hypothetical protein